VSVIPGTVYTINIGAGGLGGAGGCPLGVNQGTDGSIGGTTSFSDSNGLLVDAFGGSGGEKGVVSCGCPGAPNGGNYQTCPGSIEGASGVDGSIVNYDSPLTTPSLPSYIPTDYLTPIADCCANAGSPGGGNGCNIISNSDNNYPKFEQGAQAGSDGEVGFCAISY
jgi:hypothetical protein